MAGAPLGPAAGHTAIHSHQPVEKGPIRSRDGRVSVVEDVKPQPKTKPSQALINLKLHKRGIRVVEPHTGGSIKWKPARKAPLAPTAEKPVSENKSVAKNTNLDSQTKNHPVSDALVTKAADALIAHRTSTVGAHQNRNEVFKEMLTTYNPAGAGLDNEEYSELEFLLNDAANDAGEKLPADRTKAIKEVQVAIHERLSTKGSRILAGPPPAPPTRTSSLPQDTREAVQSKHSKGPRIKNDTPPPPPKRTSSLPKAPQSDKPTASTITPEKMSEARKVLSLRPGCHTALLDALNGNLSPQETRKKMVDGYADYYSTAQIARGSKESKEDYVLNLVKTMQQQASHTSADDLAPLRGLVQRDISGDVDAATIALGLKTMDSKRHAFDTFKDLTGVTINRQVGTAQLTGKANPTGEGAKMANFTMVDTTEIDGFVRQIQQQQGAVVGQTLREEVATLRGIKNPEKVWKKLEKKLAAGLRKDMQRSINPALNGASTRTKAQRIQAEMEQRLATRMKQSKSFFIAAATVKH